MKKLIVILTAILILAIPMTAHAIELPPMPFNTDTTTTTETSEATETDKEEGTTAADSDTSVITTGNTGDQQEDSFITDSIEENEDTEDGDENSAQIVFESEPVEAVGEIGDGVGAEPEDGKKAAELEEEVAIAEDSVQTIGATEASSASFPWVFVIIGGVALAGIIVAVVIIVKKKKA